MTDLLERSLALLGSLIISFNLSADISHEEFSNSIDGLFDSRENKPGCAVGVIKDGEYIHNKGYGMANLEHDIAITSDTIFRIGSVSKQFTAMLIALLEERGKLSFDDEMKQYIPDLYNYKKKVTINHMIHHFSGLGDYEDNDYPDTFKNAIDEEFRWGNEDYFSNDEFHQIIKDLPLIRDPEKKFWYSNTGYVLLSLVAQNISGMTLRELAQKEIFNPLQMNDSIFNDDVNLIIKNRADAYSPRKGYKDEYKINVTNLSWIGDGGLYTSLNDFIKWDQNFYSNKLGMKKSSLIKTMEQSYLETKVNSENQNLENEKEDQYTYAFAQNLSYFNGLKKWSHSGSWVGWLAHYTRFEEIGFSIVVFCNTDEIDATAINNDIIELYFQLGKN
ncbi:MAG: serine hydrolase [Gammaproteobacteria bacterium]|nr:beta-lactamase family protein [Gammaproteobacteria bacterium]MBT5216520.1 beta-lactamase family protein [Gammaproteobacteria bacterium]MBT6074459.1 beta-lactamase family protein [Gammaproteobacteria bacterium]MDG2229275.1 serine hydrolase [Gammaproteobacteria bacterium]